MNKKIWLLTFSDTFSWGTFFAVTSLVGIYLSPRLGANAIEVIGIGNAIALMGRASAQVPIGILADKIKSHRDEVYFLILGNLLMGLPFLLYPVIQSVLPYLLLQIAFGIGCAFNLVNWRKLFAMNLDKGKEGLQYAVYDTFSSVAMAVISVIAGLVAGKGEQYFTLVIFGTGVIMVLSSILVVAIFGVKASRRKSKTKDETID